MNCSTCSLPQRHSHGANTLQRCTRCTLPITWETVYFDKEGVCNICRNWEKKQKTIDWKSREKKLKKIFQDVKHRGLTYDCVVPFSGGKDSSFTLYALVKTYGLRPLVVSFDHGFFRPNMLKNRTRTFRRLGVDVITFTPNWQIVKKLMLESLLRKGDFCWHCHAGIFAYPMKIAVKFGIPLVIWGEGSGEYEGYFKYEDLEETDEWKFNRRIIEGMRAEDLNNFIHADIRDLEPYVYPSKSEIDKVGIKSLPLGKFMPWDVQKQVAIIKRELGWQEDELESGLPGLTYEKIECMFQGVRDYIKYLKRGFSRMTHLTTLDIRHGRLTRKKGMELIYKYEGKKPKSLAIFLEYIGITEDQFNLIVAQHLIPPAQPMDTKKLKPGIKLKDQDHWFRDKKIKSNKT